MARKGSTLLLSSEALADLPDDVADAYRRSLVRSTRFRHQRFLWSWSSLRRVRACTRRRCATYVEVGTAGDVGAASLRGVQRCGSIHACPSCCPKIRNGRAQEINEGVLEHLARGGGAVFVTLTLPHDQGDRLDALWSSVAGVWSDIIDSGPWRATGDWLGLPIGRKGARKLGVIRSLEVTEGVNGWHPHLHNLVLTDRPMDDAELASFSDMVFDGWCTGVVARGWRSPTAVRGIDVQRVESAGELGTYIAGLDGTRIDLELARGDLKRARNGSRTPFGILASICATGDVGAAVDAEGKVVNGIGYAELAKWWEYEAASKGKNAITWTHGLKKHLGVGVVTDRELAEEEVGHVAKLYLGGDSWRRVCEAGYAAPLMSAVERGDQAAAVEVMEWSGVIFSFVWWGSPPG